MSYEIRADYRQQLLLPRSVEEWVAKDHPARFIRETVDGLELVELGFSRRVADDGRPNYAADLLVKAWLYGYMNAIRSSRKLERACREQMGLIWLTGGHEPDHNTLWRFWRDNRSALRKLMKAISRLALRNGLVDLVLHAVDGTKVVARASKQGVLSRERIDKELSLLDAAIEEVVEQVDREGSGELCGAGYRLPEQWAEATGRREQLLELLSELQEQERQQIHPLEPKARLAKTRSDGTTLTHNAQAVVDSRCGVVVASEVIEENTDNHALVQMIQEVRETLGQVGQQTVADAGYYSGQELARAQELGLEVVVNEQNSQPASEEQRAYHHTSFQYDTAKDCCICPQGRELAFEREKFDRNRGQVDRLFRCKSFASCPVRAQCSKDPRGRSVRLSRYHGAILAQRNKQHAPAIKALLKQRAQIVERVFGTIKEVMGFRRFTFGDRGSIRTQWAMVCGGYNLRKMLSAWRVARLAV